MAIYYTKIFEKNYIICFFTLLYSKVDCQEKAKKKMLHNILYGLCIHILSHIFMKILIDILLHIFDFKKNIENFHDFFFVKKTMLEFFFSFDFLAVLRLL